MGLLFSAIHVSIQGMINSKLNGIYIAPGRKLWEHELNVANILALAGYKIEFLPETSIKQADVLLNGIEFEIKSPKSATANSLEHLLKKALKQSPNIIIDTSRIKKSRDENIKNFLISQVKTRKRIKHLIMITKHGQVIDISTLV